MLILATWYIYLRWTSSVSHSSGQASFFTSFILYLSFLLGRPLRAIYNRKRLSRVNWHAGTEICACSLHTAIMLFSTTALSFLTLLGYVNAHGFVTNIKGANGKTANGFGVNAASIRPNNQGPTSVFRGNAPCGVGVEAGTINVATSIEAAIAAGLPTVDSTGSISMIWEQINAGNDGGGPGTAAIDVTGTGNNFKPLTITKNFGSALLPLELNTRMLIP
jgi:hypothetical protein